MCSVYIFDRFMEGLVYLLNHLIFFYSLYNYSVICVFALTFDSYLFCEKIYMNFKLKN